jgi:chromosome segregation ATPase
MVDASQDILQEIQRRLESMDTHLGAIDTRLGSVETRLGSMDTRLVLTNARLRSLDSRSTAVEEAVAGLSIEIKTWPDMHYLASAAKAQLAHSRDFKADVSDLKVKIE